LPLSKKSEDGRPSISIDDVPLGDRESLFPILEESFEGWYLRHSKRTLTQIEVVKECRVNGDPSGLVMLKHLGNKLGYVYYIAVGKSYRGKGIGGKLLDNSISYFFDSGMNEVYASVEEDNEESKRLFRSRGFKITTRGEMARKYGTINSFVLLRKMVIVPGEEILYREIGSRLAETEEKKMPPRS
jgi:ribosomal protein S18 acetylase RimI-like enzyme